LPQSITQSPDFFFRQVGNLLCHVLCSMTFKHSILFCLNFRTFCLILEFWSVRNKQRPPPLIDIFRNIDQLGLSVCFFSWIRRLTNCVTGSAIGHKLLVDVEMSQSVTEIVRLKEWGSKTDFGLQSDHKDQIFVL
jgi:hypothetical protein